MNRCLQIATVILLIGGLAVAQTDQTGVLTGTVGTADGNPIAGATVAAERLDGSNARSATTDPSGRFQIGFMEPGLYMVTVRAEGYREQIASNVRISASDSARMSIQLSPATAEFSEEITVTAELPLIRTQTTEYQMSLDAAQTELLPSSRTATDLVKFTPGASNDTTWGGSTDQANVYQLDGVVVNSPGFGGSYLIPNVDWIEELQVKGLGAGAEYGNFQGGLINIVTRSGGNELHGGARFYYEDESLADSNINTFDSGFEQDRRWEINADLGGPITRDRLYYFVSVQFFELDDNIVDGINSAPDQVTFLPEQRKREETKLYGKLTWEPATTDRVNAVLGWDDLQIENRSLDSFTEPAAAEIQDSPALFYNANWSKTLTDSLFMELKLAGWSSDNERRAKNGDLPSVQILGGNRELFRNAKYDRDQEPETLTLNANFDWFVSTGDIRHTIKLGGEYEMGSWLELRRRTAGYTWRPEEGDGPFDPDDPATWGFISSDWGNDITLDAQTLNAALYVQDYIDITPRIRLSAGLRWGIWEGDLTPGFGGGGSFNAVKDNAIDPRIGLVWDLAGDASWVAKAHWGRYHQNLFALHFDRVIGGNVFQDEEYWDWIGPGLPDVNRVYNLEEREQLFELFDVNPASDEVGPAVDYEQPYVDQIVVGIEHALTDQWKVGVTYINRENKKILALVDRNLDSNFTAFNNVEVVDYRSGDPILDANGNPLVLRTVYVSNDDILSRGWAPGLSDEEVASLTWDRDFVLQNVDNAVREFDQVQLVFDGRGEWWDLGGSIVYTDLTGNFFTVQGYGDADGTAAGAYVDPNEAINFNGKLRDQSEWEFKLRFDATLPWNLRTGAYLRYFSGNFYTPVYQIDNSNHDFIAENGEFFSFRHFSDVNRQDIYVEERGSREYDSSTLLDLHLDKLIPVGSGTDFIVGFDVFNVFGEDAVTEVQDQVNSIDFDDPSSLFGGVRRREDPRTWRIYLAVRW
jgi:hypothetical protein